MTTRTSAQVRTETLWLGLVLLAAGLLMGRALSFGMIGQDEGQLSQGAERVLGGALPHRDVHEMYSGALTYLHAGALRLFGVRMVSLRFLLALATCPFALCYYLVARRFLSRAEAAGLTIAAVTLSVFLYPPSLPTWYLLYLTTLGCWVMLRYAETGRSGWLAGAGAVWGVALTFKITALYGCAASLLSILAVYLSRGPNDSSNPSNLPKTIGAGRRGLDIAIACLAAFCGVASTLAVLRQDLSLETLAYLAAPSITAALLPAILLRRQPKALPGDIGDTGPQLPLRGVILFALCLLLPVLAFSLNWILRGALGDLLNGVFVLPLVRMRSAAFPPPTLATILPALPLLFLTFAPPRMIGRATVGPVVLWTGYVALMATRGPAGGWSAAEQLYGPLRYLLPLTVLTAAARLAIFRGNASIPPAVSIVLIHAAFFWLNQYPYCHLIYFLHCLPLVLLTLGALGSSRPALARNGILAAVLLLAGGALVRYGSAGLYRERYPGPTTFRTVDLPRCGLQAESQDAASYEQLVRLIRAHSSESEPILAGPDLPEVYFLSGRRNVTPTIFEIFDQHTDHDAYILDLIRTHQFPIVVINLQPEFSREWSATLVDRISRNYRQTGAVGRFGIFVGYVAQPAAPPSPPPR